MPRVRVIHWNAAEAAGRAERLRQAGFDADSYAGPGGPSFRALAANPPDAIVIDLSRIPSQGAAAGVAFRQRKATRTVPLVFIEGDPEKTANVRAMLPDAVCTTWPKVGAALRGALRRPKLRPVVPETFAGYAGTPLAKKLRIMENSAVALLHPPDGFHPKLAPLPPGVHFEPRADAADVILLFVKSTAALARELPSLAKIMRKGRTLWIVWPKKTSALAGDLAETAVREMGLAAGLVDYKICAVDADWSGLAFAPRAQTKKGRNAR